MHAPSWIGAALQVRTYPLGVASFGQPGSFVGLCREYAMDAAHIQAACRKVLTREAAT